MRKGRGCMLQYQHSSLRVLTPFTAQIDVEPLSGAEPVEYFLGPDWQVKTHPKQVSSELPSRHAEGTWRVFINMWSLAAFCIIWSVFTPTSSPWGCVRNRDASLGSVSVWGRVHNVFIRQQLEVPKSHLHY